MVVVAGGGVAGSDVMGMIGEEDLLVDCFFLLLSSSLTFCKARSIGLELAMEIV